MKSGSQILNFLVNDILDLAQIKQGKFRKDCSNFNICEAVEEVILVQQMKAEHSGIDLRHQMINFYAQDGDEADYIICTD